MRIFITGDSHTAVLKSGVDMLLRQGDLPEDYRIDIRPLGGGDTLKKPFFVDNGDFAEITNNKHQKWIKKLSFSENIHRLFNIYVFNFFFQKRIKRLPFSEQQEHYDYYVISGPLHTVRIWRRRAYWKKYTPFIPYGNQIPVSTGLLRHVVRQDQRYVMQLIELLTREGVNVFVVEAPKPFKHHPILKWVNPGVISYIDGFYRKLMREWLASKGVPVINVPSDCYDADGFMLEKFRHENPSDPHHADKEFGAIMIREIIEFVKSRD